MADAVAAEIARLHSEIDTLRDRCEAYKGQVKAGSNEIARYRVMRTQMQFELE